MCRAHSQVSSIATANADMLFARIGGMIDSAVGPNSTLAVPQRLVLASALAAVAESGGTAERAILRHAEVETSLGKTPIRHCYATTPTFHCDGLLPLLSLTEEPALQSTSARLLEKLGVTSTDGLPGLTRAAQSMVQSVRDGRNPLSGPAGIAPAFASLYMQFAVACGAAANGKESVRALFEAEELIYCGVQKFCRSSKALWSGSSSESAPDLSRTLACPILQPIYGASLARFFTDIVGLQSVGPGVCWETLRTMALANQRNVAKRDSNGVLCGGGTTTQHNDLTNDKAAIKRIKRLYDELNTYATVDPAGVLGAAATTGVHLLCQQGEKLVLVPSAPSVQPASAGASPACDAAARKRIAATIYVDDDALAASAFTHDIKKWLPEEHFDRCTSLWDALVGSDHVSLLSTSAAVQGDISVDGPVELQALWTGRVKAFIAKQCSEPHFKAIAGRVREDTKDLAVYTAKSIHVDVALEGILQRHPFSCAPHGDAIYLLSSGSGGNKEVCSLLADQVTHMLHKCGVWDVSGGKDNLHWQVYAYFMGACGLQPRAPKRNTGHGSTSGSRYVIEPHPLWQTVAGRFAGTRLLCIASTSAMSTTT